jgi:hypothetical protein
MIDVFYRYWIDFIASIIASWFLRGTLTGNFYTSGRGGGVRLVASIKSKLARFVFLLIGVGIVVWTVIDVRHKMQM